MEDLKIPSTAYIKITVPDFKEGHEELEELLNFLKSKGYKELTEVSEWLSNNQGVINIYLKRDISPNKEVRRVLNKMLATLEKGLKENE